MNKPTKLFLWSSTCFASWLSTGCQPSKALTASQPVPSLIPAVGLAHTSIIDQSRRSTRRRRTNPAPRPLQTLPLGWILEACGLRHSRTTSTFKWNCSASTVPKPPSKRRSDHGPHIVSNAQSRAATTALQPKTPKVRKMTTLPLRWASRCLRIRRQLGRPICLGSGPPRTPHSVWTVVQRRPTGRDLSVTIDQRSGSQKF